MWCRAIVLVLCLTTLAACGDSGSGVPTGTVALPQSDENEVIAGLCEMSAELDGDVVAGRRLFYDRVHARLHSIAAEAQVIDAIAAGSLLEAKQLVESDLEADEAPAGYERHVEDLLLVAQDAVVLIGLSDPGCAA